MAIYEGRSDARVLLNALRDTDARGAPRFLLLRGPIQEIWAEDVRQHGAEGPPPIANTAAALDPALWFFGRC